MTTDATFDPSITPFRIDIPQADVDDLLSRLERTRFANELPAASWRACRPAASSSRAGSTACPAATCTSSSTAGATSSTGGRSRPSSTSMPTSRRRSTARTSTSCTCGRRSPTATPLILAHGWPNTFVEYVDLIGPLTDPRAHGGDPANAFHVVIPDIPGFGFSGPTHERGWDATRVAKALAELMRRLGYERYGVHGNDAGAIIAPILGRIDAEHVIGVHVNQIFSFPSGDPAEFEGLPEADLRVPPVRRRASWSGRSTTAVSGRSPRRSRHALADSPTGQLAWIVQLLAGQDPDVILTNASIYWFTNTGASSARFYYENHHAEHTSERTTAPIGLASFAFDMKTVRRFAERDHAQHRLVERVRPGQPLGRSRRARPADRRHPAVLRLARLSPASSPSQSEQ